MDIPTYTEMIDPLLRFLGEKEGAVKPAEAYRGVAEKIGLSEDAKRILVPSGTQPIYKNRIGWAQDALKRNGLSWTPKWGRWEITEEGRQLLEKYGGYVPEDVAKDISLSKRSIPVSELLNESEKEYSDASEIGLEISSPQEKVEQGIKEINASVARELHELILRSSPEFFEQLVLDLLHTMGYGTDRSSLQRVGGAGDGGIDGIISLDKLGLEKVYIQAKRWKDQVGSPVIQGFVGALQLQGASKGVLITSGSFSKPALEAAGRANVVLIDGHRLTQLMIDFELGISSRIIRVPSLDSDYFEE